MTLNNALRCARANVKLKLIFLPSSGYYFNSDNLDFSGNLIWTELLKFTKIFCTAEGKTKAGLSRWTVTRQVNEYIQQS